MSNVFTAAVIFCIDRLHCCQTAMLEMGIIHEYPYTLTVKKLLALDYHGQWS